MSEDKPLTAKTLGRAFEAMARGNGAANDNAGPGKIIQVFNIGPAPGVLTESGHIFALGREEGKADGALYWECMPAPTAEDMKRLMK